MKNVSGGRGIPALESYYTYDDAGRMQTITSGESDRMEYRYATDGSSTSVQTFDPKVIESTRHAAFGGSARDAASSGFGVPMGGKVTIDYDKNNRATDMRILTGDGQVVTHMVRKYDDDGRLLEEKPVQQNLGLLMLEHMSPEQRAQITPEFIEGVNRMMAGKRPPLTTYQYDREGRLTQKVNRNGFFEESKTIAYNDHGDRVEERTTYEENSTIPVGVPQTLDAEGRTIPSQAVSDVGQRGFPIPDTHARYAYKYDNYGNWTEKVTTRDGVTLTTRRTITYY